MNIPLIVVRLKTSCWLDASGIHFKKTLRVLKRMSSGHDFLTEDIRQVGADETIFKITNLNECEDGLYEVCIINETRDCETGYVDDWEFKLIPYVGEKLVE